ncbi:MAG TPA: acyl-CoA desaturase [Bacteroidia bacterium]|nr:acyl-CoA desaturase [Bacteroidia bacterium]
MSKKGQVKFISHDNEFFSTLKSRVEAYFRENNISKNYNAAMVIKTITLLSFYFLPFIYILVFQPPFWLALILWSVMGVSMAGIGMSVMHDANHGAYSGNATANKFIGYALNLLGGSIFNWKFQHNILHHTYTNISGMDDDIDEKLGMRFSPHTPHRKIQKGQFIYAFFLYSIITLYWVTLKDFLQFARYTREGVNPGSRSENAVTLLKITILKIVYFFFIMVMPVVFFHIPFYQVLTGFLLLHAIGGLILSVVFQLAHTVEGTTHPMADEKGTIENNWAIHQMNTTMNFARKSKSISWYVGGLNFQVEHHLFPKICHVHYPEIAHIVKETAEEFGVPYLESPTFMDALRSHINTLKRFGNVPRLDEVVAG